MAHEPWFQKLEFLNKNNVNSYFLRVCYQALLLGAIAQIDSNWVRTESEKSNKLKHSYIYIFGKMELIEKLDYLKE